MAKKTIAQQVETVSEPILRLFPIGTTVIITRAKLEGQITAIQVMEGTVIYKISYFLNGNFDDRWLHDYEFMTNTTERLTIGFKQS